MLIATATASIARCPSTHLDDVNAVAACGHSDRQDRNEPPRPKRPGRLNGRIRSCAAASAAPSAETTQAYALPVGKVAGTDPRRPPQTRDETVTTSDTGNGPIPDRAPLVPSKLIDAGVVPGPWRRLVFGHPEHEDGAVSWHAYAFCVLEQFWRHLKRREIWAGASTR